MKAKLLIPSVRVPRPVNTHVARFLLPMLLITLALILVGGSVQAHGSGFYLIRGAQIAPYSVHVWVAPGVLRTGDVHIDTVILGADGKPALNTLVRVSLVSLESETKALTNLVGAPNPEYPYARGASFRIDTPGVYRLEIAVSDSDGASGVTTADVEVTTIGWPAKAAIALLLLFSFGTCLWLLVQTRAFLMRYTSSSGVKPKNLHIRSMGIEGYISGESCFVDRAEMTTIQGRLATWIQRINGPLHAHVLWIFMTIIVMYGLDHLLQTYQIYGLGWSPANAGGVARRTGRSRVQRPRLPAEGRRQHHESIACPSGGTATIR